jgi:hypothetical protein
MRRWCADVKPQISTGTSVDRASANYNPMMTFLMELLTTFTFLTATP